MSSSERKDALRAKIAGLQSSRTGRRIQISRDDRNQSNPLGELQDLVSELEIMKKGGGGGSQKKKKQRAKEIMAQVEELTKKMPGDNAGIINGVLNGLCTGGNNTQSSAAAQLLQQMKKPTESVVGGGGKRVNNKKKKRKRKKKKKKKKNNDDQPTAVVDEPTVEEPVDAPLTPEKPKEIIVDGSGNTRMSFI